MGDEGKREYVEAREEAEDDGEGGMGAGIVVCGR